MNRICVLNMNASDRMKSRIEAAGYDIIEVYPNLALPEPEMCHADMQFARINNKCTVYSPSANSSVLEKMKNTGIELCEGSTNLSNKYPLNIAYNVLVSTKCYFHNMKFTDNVVSKQLQKEGLSPINVKQGYAGCSSIFLNDILITSDYGIAKAAKQNKYRCYILKDSKMIKLKGYDHGFIGGCCGFDGLNLLITGKINNLELIDYDDKYSILPFDKVIKDEKINVISLDNSFPEDVGGLQLYKI